MPDPLNVLRADADGPATPDPAWAARLRDRLASAITASEDEMSTETAVPATAPVATTSPTQLTPYLAVADARSAIAWYVDAFGAAIVGEPVVMPDGRIGHSELLIGEARLYLSDAHPEVGVDAPAAGAAAAVTLHLETGAVDRLVTAATARGATVDRPPADTPYGRQAVLHDPFGHRWMLMSSAGDASSVEPMRDGDLAYVSLWVPDPARAATFYSAVLGWRWRAGTDRSWLTDGLSVDIGTARHDSRPGLLCCYGVADLDNARNRVRDAGGEAGEATTRDYGRTAACRDVAGRRFALWEIRPGTARPPMNGAVPGDIGYLTMHVGDSAAARAFYGAVFGWRFTPGSVDDGWQVDGPAPMTGLAGGRDSAGDEVLWLVGDIDQAVRRVAAAGGEPGDVEVQPYGRTATCTDDQGMRFGLGEL